MASLDNFPSNNGPQRQYPTLTQRLRLIRDGLYSSQAKDWDLANAVPMAPVQPPDAALMDRTGGAHPSPQITERLSHRSMKDHLVPTNPQVHAMRGDTADSLQVVDTGAQSRGWLKHALGWVTGSARARVRTYSRFHPYMR